MSTGDAGEVHGIRKAQRWGGSKRKQCTIVNKGMRERRDSGVKEERVGDERFGCLGAGRGRKLTMKRFISNVSVMWKKKEMMKRIYMNPSFASSCPLLSPLPSFHFCTLSATGPSKFPWARGSPLSVSSDTVIRSVGTESVPLSEPRTPSLSCSFALSSH